MGPNDEAAAQALNEADVAVYNDLVAFASKRFGQFAKAVMQHGRASLPPELKPEAYDLFWLMWSNNGVVPRPKAMKRLQFKNGSSFSHFLNNLHTPGSHTGVNWVTVARGVGPHGADELRYGDEHAKNEIENLLGVGFWSYAKPFTYLSVEDLQNLADILGKLDSALKDLKSAPPAADTDEPEQLEAQETGAQNFETEVREGTESGEMADVVTNACDAFPAWEDDYYDNTPIDVYDEQALIQEPDEGAAAEHRSGNSRSRLSARDKPHEVVTASEITPRLQPETSDEGWDELPEYLR
jgi:hypothetical protein